MGKAARIGGGTRPSLQPMETPGRVSEREGRKPLSALSQPGGNNNGWLVRPSYCADRKGSKLSFWKLKLYHFVPVVPRGRRSGTNRAKETPRAYPCRLINIPPWGYERKKLNRVRPTLGPFTGFCPGSILARIYGLFLMPILENDNNDKEWQRMTKLLSFSKSRIYAGLRIQKLLIIIIITK